MGQDKFMMMIQNDTVSLKLSIFVLWLGMGRDLGTMYKVIFQRWVLVSPGVWVNPSSILVLSVSSNETICSDIQMFSSL